MTNDIFAAYGVEVKDAPTPPDVKTTTNKKVDTVKLREAAEQATALAKVVPDIETKHTSAFQGKGNPAPFTVQQLAKQYTEEAILTAVEIMRGGYIGEDDKGRIVISSVENSTRLEAAKLLLDRGWGKATVKAELNANIKVDIHSTLAELAAQVKAPPALGEDHALVTDVEVQE